MSRCSDEWRESWTYQAAPKKTRTILTKICLALHRAGDWDVYGKKEAVKVGDDEVCVMGIDNKGFKEIVNGKGAGYLQKTASVWRVIPRDVLQRFFDLDVTKRNLEIHPLSLADFQAEQGSFGKLGYRHNDYCELGLMSAAELLRAGADISSMPVGKTFDSTFPTMTSCHYKIDGREHLLALLDDDDDIAEEDVDATEEKRSGGGDGGSSSASRRHPTP